MSLIYSKEAKIRITALGSSNILIFLEKIPQKVISNFLPKVDGFKSKSAREHKERLKKLVHMLTHSNIETNYAEREWSALGMIWLMWGGANYNKLFSVELENMTFDEKNEMEFLQKFIKICEPDGCSNADALKLMEFSGFPLSTAATDLLSRLPSEDFLEQKRNIRQLKKDISDLHEIIKNGNNEFFSDSFVRTSIFEESLKSITALINKRIESQSEVILENLEEKSSMRDNHELISARLVENTERLDVLENLLEEFEEKIVAAGENIRIMQEATSTKCQIDNTIIQENTKPFKINNNIYSQNIQIKNLESIDDAANLLSENFHRIGINRLDAEIISGIVAASIFSGQIVQFCGSLAEILADATSCTLFSGKHLVWHIPLGLCDSSIGEDLLSEVKQESAEIRGVCLKGANRSAFEIYGDHVKNLIVSRQLESGDLNNNTSFVATWVDGPSTHLDCRPLLELGPLVDTDKLKWGRPKWKNVISGNLVFPFSKKTNTSSASDLLEAETAISALSMPITQLRKWIVIRALFWLFQIEKKETAKIIDSIAIGWILPWAASNDLDDNEFQASLEKHMPDIINNEIVNKLLASLQKH